jgi:hypothetical protein
MEDLTTMAPMTQMMHFSVSSLIASLIFGLVGFYLFREGRRRDKKMVMVIGLILMMYNMFTPNAKADWILGFILSGAAYYFWNDA